jgi:ferrous iron transport protein B
VKVALFGNPNTGKSSVFNMLTGLRQQVGNFPGVTVEKKSGTFKIAEKELTLIDFPGTYSIYPRTKDEEVVYQVMTDKSSIEYPELALVVLNASQLKRNLLLCSQLYDLNIPLIIVVNMSDIAQRKGITLDLQKLESLFPGSVVVSTNARIGLGKDRLLEAISIFNFEKHKSENKSIIAEFEPSPIDNLSKQVSETKARKSWIDSILPALQKYEETKTTTQSKLDKILVHWFWGYLIFIAILLVVFQFIYAFASYPMDAIDMAFIQLSNLLQDNLPEGIFSNLISQGIVPGIGGVVIFIPQIALLFFFISILEETGYLSRVVFIMDRIMRPLGLNGKSVVPLMSSVACAIPGVMSARTISDWRERLITILVAPLMSCSARIPVYTLLIALVIPDEPIFGFFNLRGIVLFSLYALGLVSALVIAFVLKKIIRTKDKGFLVLEMPEFKSPRWQNVWITVYEKVRIFVWDAGKVILAISVILWVLASFGPGNSLEKAEQDATVEIAKKSWNEDEKNQFIASAKLEKSYMGIMGKTLEPIIEPLGYDWKIGVSLLTSFAAREVFVGSLATIYAVHDTSDDNTLLINRLRMEKKADGTPIYTLATGSSLLVFYVFAMQCMSTLAVVKRETNSWKWPIFQLVFMGVLAYSMSFLTFMLLS